MFHVPSQFRITNHPFLSTDESHGNNGAFKIPLEGGATAWAIASDGELWEHVSVHIVEDEKDETPVWDEMCLMKNLFWDAEDCVVQFHPPEIEYVNNHSNVLHLWRPVDLAFPRPPAKMVGIK